MAPNMAFESASSGSAMARVAAASLFASTPTTGVSTSAFFPYIVVLVYTQD